MSVSTKTALIVGASRGLGLGLAGEYLKRGWRVIATQRSASRGLAALAHEHGARLQVVELDMTDDAAIAALRTCLGQEKLDLLFVSAGINIDRTKPVGAVPLDEFLHVMTVNALAPMRVLEMFADLVPSDGAIAAMTSVLGSVTDNTSGGYEVYRASKAALNTLLRSFSARMPDHAVVAMHPGWVRTDMGGAHAAINIAESATGMADVLASFAGRAGCVYVDYQGATIPW